MSPCLVFMTNTGQPKGFMSTWLCGLLALEAVEGLDGQGVHIFVLA
jgi:hypothetical protein